MRILIALLLLPLTAAAETPPVQLSYEAYVAGFRVFTLQALAAVAPEDYRIDIGYRTVGVLGSFFSGDLHSMVQGRFRDLQPRPLRYMSWGLWFGEARQTMIDYPEGNPVIRALIPEHEKDREPVPAAMTPDTVDSLSAVAMLVRHATANGRCEGKVRVFDGRRLSDIVSRTGGMETLEADHGSHFTGPALRCDFVGQQLAGFLMDGDQERMHRPQEGAAWLASPAPGIGLLPVRIRFQVRLFGSGTLYLSDVLATPGQFAR